VKGRVAVGTFHREVSTVETDFGAKMENGAISITVESL